MILHIALNGWFWDRPFTGSGQYTQELVGTLRTVDPTLRLTLIVPSSLTPQNVPGGVEVVSVRVPAIGAQLGKIWFEQRGFPAAVRRSGADIAHVPYWGPPLESPARLVVTVHDVIPLSMPIYQGGFGARLYTSLVTAGVKGAAHLITDSAFSRDEIIAWIDGFPAEHITAIPLAVSPAMHPRLGAERDAEIRKKYNLPDSYVLYLGSFDIRKNLKTLIAAYTYIKTAALNDEYPLILAGKPPATWGTDRFPDLPAEIARLGLGDSIRFIGPVDEADKPGVYRMARLTTFPSRYEGFGLTPLESMACGTPVVTADSSSIPEVVGDAAYMVDPLDARALSGAIIAVLIQDDLHENLRNQGLARATNFSWHKTAAATLDIYRAVVARKDKSK